MKTWFFRLLFSLSSFSGILLFLVINANCDIPYVKIPSLFGQDLQSLLVIKYFLSTLWVIFFAKGVLWLSQKSLEAADNIQVAKIKPVEGTFLPIYIGLFVIALSFTDGFSIEAIFLTALLFILWILFENVSYFNPFFLFWGYRFYEVETANGITVLIITKRKDLKRIEQFTSLTRINHFTFLEYSYG